ncbi:MAG: hypothetical protein M1817_001849 [Caeruleum heppii]|nr:MAG: hypothetical protein M1817_001849 [Caeruleum heppii]
MTEAESPPKHTFGRIPRPRGFLPLNTEEVLSTRGQKFPTLIQLHSSGSLQALSGLPNRRPSSVRDEEASGGGDRERERAGEDEGRDGSAADRNMGKQALNTPKMRSARLIGNSNPRYQWEKYVKTADELKKMKKPIRKYYERTNSLVEQYCYIDRLLDSSLPHNLIQEYSKPGTEEGIPQTVLEEPSANSSEEMDPTNASGTSSLNGSYPPAQIKVKRTPKAIYKVPTEGTPLLIDGPSTDGNPSPASPVAQPEAWQDDEDDSQSEESIVRVAIYINLVANTILLFSKIAVIVLTSSLSVLASLVDAALDFLSTAIVWTTTRLIARQDQYAYPVGRRRLEPIGVLVFSVVMITSFFQVLLECFQRLTSGDHEVVQLGLPAIVIMASTVVIKFACWLWCRLIKNSSVQALAQDALTDVVFNTFSIIFPLVGYYLSLWPLDAIGGIALSLYVILSWAYTSSTHIRNLTGFASSPDERNVLLYLTMRFASTIKQIQSLAAYHAGDRLNVEVDVVIDEDLSLRDSHDLGESLQYVLESVPFVDRAFVHLDYEGWNLPSHMRQVD